MNAYELGQELVKEANMGLVRGAGRRSQPIYDSLAKRVRW